VFWPFGLFYCHFILLYGHLVNLVVILVYFFPFWYVVPRKIWLICKANTVVLVRAFEEERFFDRTLIFEFPKTMKHAVRFYISSLIFSLNQIIYQSSTSIVKYEKRKGGFHSESSIRIVLIVPEKMQKLCMTANLGQAELCKRAYSGLNK
jgi:hypothetical protein